MIKQFFSKKKSPAPRSTVTEGMLVLSFPDARDGAIWRLPLAKAEASSFQLTNDKGEIQLTMTSEGSKKEVLAIYYEPERARRALDAVMDAIIRDRAGFMSDESSSRSSNGNDKKSGWFKKIFMYLIVAIIGVGLAIGLVTFFSNRSPVPGIEQSAQENNNADDGSEAGVPQSVDELFGAN